jgi:hypothetical protein
MCTSVNYVVKNDQRDLNDGRKTIAFSVKILQLFTRITSDFFWFHRFIRVNLRYLWCNLSHYYSKYSLFHILHIEI